MRLLALDTATEAMSLCVADGDTVHAHFEVAGRRHSERLLPRLRALFATAGFGPRDLDGLVVGVGPGSFVGVRVGLSLIKGMAAGLGLPVYPVGSLALIAAAQPGGRVAVSVDARMDEVYFGVFEREGVWLHTLQAPAVLPPGQLAVPAGARCLGTGFARWPASVGAGCRGPGGASDLPDIRHALPAVRAGRIAAVEPSALEPVYIRHRVAETIAERRARTDT